MRISKTQAYCAAAAAGAAIAAEAYKRVTHSYPPSVQYYPPGTQLPDGRYVAGYFSCSKKVSDYVCALKPWEHMRDLYFGTAELSAPYGFTDTSLDNPATINIVTTDKPVQDEDLAPPGFVDINYAGAPRPLTAKGLNRLNAQVHFVTVLNEDTMPGSTAALKRAAKACFDGIRKMFSRM